MGIIMIPIHLTDIISKLFYELPIIQNKHMFRWYCAGVYIMDNHWHPMNYESAKTVWFWIFRIPISNIDVTYYIIIFILMSLLCWFCVTGVLRSLTFDFPSTACLSLSFCRLLCLSCVACAHLYVCACAHMGVAFVDWHRHGYLTAPTFCAACVLLNKLHLICLKLLQFSSTT